MAGSGILLKDPWKEKAEVAGGRHVQHSRGTDPFRSNTKEPGCVNGSGGTRLTSSHFDVFR